MKCGPWAGCRPPEPVPITLARTVPPTRPCTGRPGAPRFRGSAPARIEVKRARAGRVLGPPGIDGRDLGWFIFDTGAGASTILHTEAAARLPHSPLGTAPITTVFGPARF